MNAVACRLPRLKAAAPVFSQTIADALTPGVVVEADAEAAEALGAFEETALTGQAAWEANADLNTG